MGSINNKAKNQYDIIQKGILKTIDHIVIHNNSDKNLIISPCRSLSSKKIHIFENNFRIQNEVLSIEKGKSVILLNTSCVKIYVLDIPNDLGNIFIHRGWDLENEEDVLYNCNQALLNANIHDIQIMDVTIILESDYYKSINMSNLHDYFIGTNKNCLYINITNKKNFLYMENKTNEKTTEKMDGTY